MPAEPRITAQTPQENRGTAPHPQQNGGTAHPLQLHELGQAEIVRLTSAPEFGEFVCAIGVFDGLHEGHRFVVGEAVRQARQLGVRAVAITFDRDPDEMFLAATDQRKLLCNHDRVKLLATSGVDCVLVIPFTPELAGKEPLDFLGACIAACGTPRGIHVGSDFRFGHKAAGTVDDLHCWGKGRGCAIRAHNLFADEGLSVTSTRIRTALLSGELALANQLLKRPHFLWAQVVEGRGAGTELGFPTANLVPEEFLVRPADGVYAGVVPVDGEIYAAAISVGVPATFEGTASTIEAHLLDFTGDLYNHRLMVFFTEYLRPMRAFSSVEDLQQTVQHNIAQARATDVTSAQALVELLG